MAARSHTTSDHDLVVAAVMHPSPFGADFLWHLGTVFYRYREKMWWWFVVELPAAWLIEQCGFKGKRYGDTGTHKKQALVLVNYGNAKGKDIFKLAKKIQKTIKETYNINLDIEVNVL